MIKEYAGKKVLKRLVAFTLCATVAVTTIFFGVPLSAKAADEDNTEYTIGVADDRNWMISADGESGAISNKGVLLWPGDKVRSSSRSFSEDNTMIFCHHGTNPPAALWYSNYVGFTISSANEVTLDTLGDLVSDEAEMITGGTMNSTTGETDDKTTGKLGYHKSFTAKKLVFLEYDKTTQTTYSTKCDCAAKTDWNVYHYYLYSFKVHEISTSDIKIEYADTAGWNSTEYPTAFAVSKNNATYSYEIPTKVGYVFDGWEFTDKDGKDLSGIINDSKDGTITVAGIDGKNWETIDDISKNGITATPKWTEKKLTVNFDPNGGVYSRVNYSEKSVCIVTEDNFIYDYCYNDTTFFSSERITREGYNFDGWYIDDDTKITCLADIPAAKSNSSQIYHVKAKWTPGDDPSGYTIDSKTGTLTVTSQNSFPSYDYGQYAKRVVVNEGITEIPEGAFRNFDMEEIKLPTTIKTIGSNAFKNCTKLKEITIPDGVAEIKDECFDNCSMLEKVVLPSQLKSIGAYAFYDTQITSVTIPDSVTDIGDYAFAKTGLQSVEIPGNVTLGGGVFLGCKQLESVKLTDGITSIPNSTFCDCTALKKITLPDTIESIGWYAFEGSGLQSVEIPKNVTLLDEGVFANCEQLESVKLTNGITRIQDKTFWGCTALKKITLPDTIESIGFDVFKNVNIEEVTFAGTEEQWAALCEREWELKNATATAKVTYVEPVAPHVHDAKLVPEVAASCKATGVKAYYTCTCGKYFEDKECKTIISNLAAWKTGAGLLAKKEHTLKKTDAKAATCVAAGNKEYWTCSDCKKVYADAEGKTETTVEKMTIPATGVPKKGTKIEDENGTAFYEVTGSDAKNPTVTYKENKSSKATTVSIPPTVTVEGVTYKVTAIADDAFKDSKKITKVTISKNVTTIGKNAFNGCTKLKTVTVGSSVTTIGAGAFKNCKALTKITLPSKTTKIGAGAFNGCSKLKTITIKSKKMTSKTISKNAFKGVPSKTTIKVPNGKAKTYKTLFQKKGLSKKVEVK